MSIDKCWGNIMVSPTETFHIFDDKPLYTERYNQVMKFHAPGLAPVKNKSYAFHIDINGNPAYTNRFIETFGYYEGLAAVRNEEGWFHITETGSASYSQRYLWCGNFQEGLCPVRDDSGYFHIKRNGEKIYLEQYAYVGDFKDGCAVVCNKLGQHTHIDYQGHFIHDQWFIDLDIFHKGYARANDQKGWFHIDKSGKPIYQEHYAMIEPFYNGIARVEALNGMLLTINTKGEKVAELRSPLQKPWQQLSGDMIGFWRTETIATAVHLKIFDYLPATTLDIAEKLSSDSDIKQESNSNSNYLERLLRAVWELNLVYLNNGVWHLTEKGDLLTSQDQNFMSGAAIMWSDVNGQEWKALPQYICRGLPKEKTLFKVNASDEKLSHYHKAIDGYTIEDHIGFQHPIDWQSHPKIIGVGRSAKTWLENILINNTETKALLLGEPYVLKHINIDSSIALRYRLQKHNILQPWPEKANLILLPKILHYWSDPEVIVILKNAQQTLLPNGKILIIEMVLEKNNPNGSLLDLNMLVESGGQLRFLADWEALAAQAQLTLVQQILINPWLNMLIFQ